MNNNLPYLLYKGIYLYKKSQNVFFILFQISNIENLNHLTELRVLNLAGNHIVHVDNLSGMDSLAELNLRRNKIKTVVCIMLKCNVGS